MLRHVDNPAESIVSRNVLQKLWAPDQQVPAKPASIKSPDEKLQQLRICNEQLEKQTAQSVGINKANELVQGHIGFGRSRQVGQKERTELGEYLARAR